MHRLLDEPHIAAFAAELGRERIKHCIAQELAERRARDASAEFDEIARAVVKRLEDERFETLLPVVNATGVLLHTNLGRAPLSQAALDAVRMAGMGYCNLEYDLRAGTRGSRYARAAALLQDLTGAQDAIVVNNCAAAVLLVLDTFAKGREVVVARSELVEIGGGFRLPEVLARSGATLVEVGATNKVYLSDYERALSPQTALLMRSHQSNFRITGFTQPVEPSDLTALGKRAGVPVVEDLGSGALLDLAQFGLPHERTVQEAVADGMDLVAFSADKLLGGPQGGIIVGTRAHIARLRSNPLIRALRTDKLTLAALSETLRIYASPHRLRELPLVAMLAATQEELRQRARAYAHAQPRAEIVESTAYLGGGTLAQTALPSIAVSLAPRDGAEKAAQQLRHREPPIVARVAENRLLLDLRGILPEQDAATAAALALL